MPNAVIENPVLNSPYDEPKRHFYLDEDGITDRVVDSRRISSYFVPIAKPKKKGKQLELETEWTADRIDHGTFGRWAFVEITDPWNTKNDIRAFLDNEAGERR